MTAIAFAVLGVLLGLGYFATLRWISAKLVESSTQGSAWLRLAIVQALRILVLTALFVWAVRHGALALIMLAAGVLCVKIVWVATARRAGRRRA